MSGHSFLHASQPRLATPRHVSSEPRVRLANPCRDNQALCELSRACPQGDRLRFYHAREDHWERCRLYSEAQVFVAERDESIVGAATVGFKDMWIDGALEQVAYFFDRMVHPHYRRQGIGRALLQSQLEASDAAALRYSLVLEDNHANRALLESEGLTAHPRRLLYFAILPGLLRRKAPAEVHYTEPIDPRIGEQLDNALQQGYVFRDLTARSADGLFEVVSTEGEACAVLYRHGPKVLVQAPWYYRWLGRVVPFVPRVHRPILSWSLCHLWATSDDAMQLLLRGVALAAWRASVTVVLLPLYENDPRIHAVRPWTVNRWGAAPARVCLYLHGELASSLLDCERPFLASGRDG